jgi:hypothetical protein
MTAPLSGLRPVHSANGPDEYRDSALPRVLGEVLVGGALGIGAAYGGAFIGLAAECSSSCSGEFGGLGGALVGAGLGLTLGATTGVVLVGSDSGHDSSFVVTYLGTVVGGVVGLIAVDRMHTDSLAGGLVVVGASTALGGSLGFHLTRTPRKASPGFIVAPVASSNFVGLTLIGRR